MITIIIAIVARGSQVFHTYLDCMYITPAIYPRYLFYLRNTLREAYGTLRNACVWNYLFCLRNILREAYGTLRNACVWKRNFKP